jgi:outer membrane usher protein FimD/PapC
MRAYICFVFFVLAAPIYGQINPTSEPIELTVDTRINKNTIGSITLIVTPKDKLVLKWPEVEPHFAPILFAQSLENIAKQANSQQLIDVDKLEKIGIEVTFSMLDFSLDITVPLSMTKPKSLSVISYRQGLKPTKPASVSGYLNLRSSYLYQLDKERDLTQRQLTVRPEGVINFHSWVLENEAEYESNDKKSNFKRLGTRLIHDLPEQGMRISVGDNYSSGSYFQSTTRMLGLSLAHDFSLVSDRPIRPSASQSFTLESPSSVEVLVDDRLVQRLNLAAGIYSLNDIPLDEGNNNIVLRITDSAGVVRLVNFTVTTGLDLFAQGQLEYEVHLGFPSSLRDKLTYAWEKPLLSSYLDYGVTPSWTIGMSAQGNEDAQQVGLKQIYATPLGQLAFENTLSLNDSNGYAYRLVYSTFNDPSYNGIDFTLGYEYTNRDYRRQSFSGLQSDGLSQREHFIQANLNIVSETRMQTSLYSTFSRRHDQAQFDKSAGLVLSSELFNHQWRYSLGGQWEDINAQSQWGFSASITYKFSNTRRVKLSHQSKRDKTRFEFNQDGNQRYVGALSVRSGLERNELNEAIFDLNTQYNANRFLASFDHGTYYKQLNSRTAYHQSRLSGAASLAFANTSWTVGKPIEDSFALVSAHSSLSGKKISLGRTESQYRASNADFNTILLSDINAYDNSTVTLDVDDLAPGYDIGAGAITFYPSYKSGHVVTVGTDANISIIATLKTTENEPLALQVGTAKCIDEEAAEPLTFFTSKSGRFALTGLKPCQYQISLKSVTHKALLIDVIKGQQLQRKGVIYVQ